MQIKRYISTGKPGLSIWKLFWLSLLIVTSVLLFSGIYFKFPQLPVIGFLGIFKISFTITLFILAIGIIYNLSVITWKKSGDTQTLIGRNLFNRTVLNGPFIHYKWWNYNFNNSAIVITGAGEPASRSTINYIYQYCHIKSTNGELVLFEEIQLSSRHPKNCKYDLRGLPESILSYKVWNLDKCLSKLGLVNA